MTTLFLRCFDGRMVTSFSWRKMADISQFLDMAGIATTVSPDIEQIAADHNVTRVIALVHTHFPNLNGCGGQAGLRSLHQGKPLGLPRLEKWLLKNMLSSNPHTQAWGVYNQLKDLLPTNVELIVCLIDNVRQQAMPMFYRHPQDNWEDFIDPDEWGATVESNFFPHVPYVNMDRFPTDTFDLFMQNWQAASANLHITEEQDFANAQSFDIVAGIAMPYSLDAFENVQRVYNLTEVVPDFYFGGYIPPLSPWWGIDQLEYGLAHSHLDTDLWIIAPDHDALLQVTAELEKRETYWNMILNPEWKGHVYPSVEEPPY